MIDAASAKPSMPEWLPASITAILIAVAGFILGLWKLAVSTAARIRGSEEAMNLKVKAIHEEMAIHLKSVRSEYHISIAAVREEIQLRVNSVHEELADHKKAMDRREDRSIAETHEAVIQLQSVASQMAGMAKEQAVINTMNIKAIDSIVGKLTGLDHRVTDLSGSLSLARQLIDLNPQA